MDQKEPRIRYLETTGMCNLNCPVCVERYRNFHMNQHDFLAIAEANAGILQNEWAWFDFSGEPLLDPLFFDRAQYMISHLESIEKHEYVMDNTNSAEKSSRTLQKNSCFWLFLKPKRPQSRGFSSKTPDFGVH